LKKSHPEVGEEGDSREGGAPNRTDDMPEAHKILCKGKL